MNETKAKIITMADLGEEVALTPTMLRRVADITEMVGHPVEVRYAGTVVESARLVGVAFYNLNRTIYLTLEHADHKVSTRELDTPDHTVHVVMDLGTVDA